MNECMNTFPRKNCQELLDDSAALKANDECTKDKSTELENTIDVSQCCAIYFLSPENARTSSENKSPAIAEMAALCFVCCFIFYE